MLKAATIVMWGITLVMIVLALAMPKPAKVVVPTDAVVFPENWEQVYWYEAKGYTCVALKPPVYCKYVGF